VRKGKSPIPGILGYGIFFAKELKEKVVVAKIKNIGNTNIILRKLESKA
jgi:hypothetical protein